MDEWIKTSYGLPDKQISELCKVTSRTVRRWRQRGAIPDRYFRHFRASLSREAGLADPSWTGWRFLDGELTDPEGNGYTPADIRSLPWKRQAIEAYAQARQRSRAESDYYRDLKSRTTTLLNELESLTRSAENLRQILTQARNRREVPNVVAPQSNTGRGQNLRLLPVARNLD